MPADITETVVEHSTRLQPSIKLHDPITAFMLRCSATDVQLRRDENSGMPCEEIEALYSILVSTQDSKPLVAAIRSLLLPNCESSHSVRVLFFDVTNILTKYCISSGLMRFQLLRTEVQYF